MSERQVTNECIEWLRSIGWICRRQHVGTFQPMSGGAPVRMGEAGACDWVCFRALPDRTADYLELELKALGKRPRPDQYEYMAKRTHQGFHATWCDSLDMLKKWYFTHFEE